MNPPAQRCVFASIFGESERAKTFAKRSVLGIGADFSDCVHIQRRARQVRTLIRNKQSRDGAAHEHELFQHRTE